MSLGPVMIDIAGTVLTAEDREWLSHPRVGGIILFTRNYASVEQLKALVEEIHALRSPRLLVAVDHEGGRVQRFREGFTRLPAVAGLGAIYDRDPRQALRLAELAGWLMAAELRVVGVDFSFAPVLDLGRGISTVIGDRAFHATPQGVARLAQAYVTGMRNAGMAATGKHFPGHGAVAADSHLALPVDDRSLEEITTDDICPPMSSTLRWIRCLRAFRASGWARCCVLVLVFPGLFLVMTCRWSASRALAAMQIGRTLH